MQPESQPRVLLPLIVGWPIRSHVSKLAAAVFLRTIIGVRKVTASLWNDLCARSSPIFLPSNRVYAPFYRRVNLRCVACRSMLRNTDEMECGGNRKQVRQNIAGIACFVFTHAQNLSTRRTNCKKMRQRGGADESEFLCDNFEFKQEWKVAPIILFIFNFFPVPDNRARLLNEPMEPRDRDEATDPRYIRQPPLSSTDRICR